MKSEKKVRSILEELCGNVNRWILLSVIDTFSLDHKSLFGWSITSHGLIRFPTFVFQFLLEIWRRSQRRRYRRWSRGLSLRLLHSKSLVIRKKVQTVSLINPWYKVNLFPSTTWLHLSCGILGFYFFPPTLEIMKPFQSNKCSFFFCFLSCLMTLCLW